MKKYIAQLTTVVGIVVIVVIAVVSSAFAADGTFGTCLKSVGPELAHYQGPGQTGTGPGTLRKDGSLPIPPAFTGAVTCFKTK